MQKCKDWLEDFLPFKLIIEFQLINDLNIFQVLYIYSENFIHEKGKSDICVNFPSNMETGYTQINMCQVF